MTGLKLKNSKLKKYLLYEMKFIFLRMSIKRADKRD
jgi:hypothetical protein